MDFLTCFHGDRNLPFWANIYSTKVKTKKSWVDTFEPFIIFCALTEYLKLAIQPCACGWEDLQCITDHDCIPVEKVERMKVHLLWKKSLKVHRQLFQLSMHLNHHVEIYEFLCILHPKFSKATKCKMVETKSPYSKLLCHYKQ